MIRNPAAHVAVIALLDVAAGADDLRSGSAALGCSMLLAGLSNAVFSLVAP